MGNMTLVAPNDEPITTTRRGRPTLYSEEKGRAICEHLERGMTKRGACGLVGIDEKTFELWAREREDFIGMLALAEAKAELAFTSSMYGAALGIQGPNVDWKAGESWLKRRRRADYGDSIDLRKVDTDKLLEMYAEMTQGELLGVEVHDDDEQAEVLADDVL